MAPSAETPRKATKRKQPSVRERFDALRNLRPFLAQIWATSRSLTLATLSLRLVRALLPVVMLYVGKLIIDEALRLVGLQSGLSSVGEWLASGLLEPLLWLLAIEF